MRNLTNAGMTNINGGYKISRDTCRDIWNYKFINLNWANTGSGGPGPGGGTGGGNNSNLPRLMPAN